MDEITDNNLLELILGRYKNEVYDTVTVTSQITCFTHKERKLTSIWKRQVILPGVSYPNVCANG